MIKSFFKEIRNKRTLRFFLLPYSKQYEMTDSKLEGKNALSKKRHEKWLGEQAGLCVNRTFDMLAKVKKLTNVDSKDIYKLYKLHQ